MYRVNEHDRTSPAQCLRSPQGREGGIRQQQHDSAHEEILEAHSSGSRPRSQDIVTRSCGCAQNDTGTTPDMVIWTVTACMLGRIGRSARKKEPSFTPTCAVYRAGRVLYHL